MEQKLTITGILPERPAGGMQTTSTNPYLIYGQSLRFLPPYLWPDQKFDTLFMTFTAGTVTLNMIINVGVLVAVFLIIMKK